MLWDLFRKVKVILLIFLIGLSSLYIYNYFHHPDNQTISINNVEDITLWVRKDEGSYKLIRSATKEEKKIL